MKIFKIKFDSKDPTDRSISVKKGDDFGIAIQIDNSATQGPTTITYGGQTISADTELVDGYNTFLLKGLADEKISVKDIDSQVIFTVNILAKDSDVVELGGTGGGGESVWQAEGADYYIDAALSVNNCQKVTITGANDQVILKANDNNASYEIACGDLKLNTAANIRIHPTGSTVPKIALDGTSPFIAFDCTYLNLTYDSGGCNNNAININGCGICIDAQQGKLYLNSSNNTLSIHGNNVDVCASTIKINGYTEFDVTVNNNKINIDTNCGRSCILIYSSEGTLNTNVTGTTLSSTGTTNIYAGTINTCAGAVCTNANYYCVNVQGYTIFDATNTYVNFGNCNMATNMFATKFSFYTTGAGNIIGSDYQTVTFSNVYNKTTIAGNKITLSAEATCGAGIITFSPEPCGGNSTILQLQSSYCNSANDYSVDFVLPSNLEFKFADNNSGLSGIKARSKVFLTLLSALETTYHNECANDDTNYNASIVDSIVYNKLTAVFATK